MWMRAPRAKQVRLALWCCLLLAGFSALPDTGALGSGPVYWIKLEAVINPGTLSVLEHAIERAEADNAAALIVQIDTPGGLISTTRDMVGAIAEAQIPVIGYVGPSGASATSAGAFILLSTHLAVMNQGTNVGASTPVSGSGEDIEGAMGRKVLNDTRAFMRSIAVERGRNADVAEQFVTDAASLSAEEALAENVIDLVTEEPANLIAAVEGRQLTLHGETITLALGDKPVVDLQPRLIDRILLHLAHPQVAHLLISLGSLAIYIEILSPGLAFPGIFGAISLVLGLISLQTLPANTGFQLLLLLGIVLMIAEYFSAGLGALGIGGAVAFVLGSLYLFDEPVATEYRQVAMPVSIAIAAAIVATSLLVGSSLRGKTRTPRLKGKTGEAMVDFQHEGYVLIDGQRYAALTEQPLRHGDTVRVTAVEKNGKLVVAKQ